jgi:two-component system response regulator RegA
MNISDFDSLRRNLLIVDDDQSHCRAMQRAFERRGYDISSANCVPQALRILENWRVDYAVVDLRMPGPSGLTLIPRLRLANADVRIVMTTGYASIATTVEAIKLGAANYLVKPVEADAVEAAFHRAGGGDDTVPARDTPLSLDRLAWEHIQGVFAEHYGNISATARALGIHRRTLQRKLGKHPVRS